MKAILTFFLVLSFSQLMQAQTSLTVVIKNVEKQDGFIEIGLYNQAKKFPKIGEQFRVVRLQPNGNELSYTFENIGTGKYAISVYHDVNNDNECNRNVLGIPTEAYAFSNDFRPKFSVPGFKDCEFPVLWTCTHTIKMVY